MPGSRKRFVFIPRPDTPEVLKMLLELRRAFPGPLLPMMLGCPAYTVNGWLAGDGCCPASAVRTIWLTWCITLHPERIQTIADLITWGYAHTTHAKKKYGRHPKG